MQSGLEALIARCKPGWSLNSSAYAPGPYSASKEYNVAGFVRWYLNLVRDA
jgi:hypothetical protein